MIDEIGIGNYRSYRGLHTRVRDLRYPPLMMARLGTPYRAECQDKHSVKQLNSEKSYI